MPSPDTTLAALAHAPRWSADRTVALPGHVRGGLLRHWADHCARRWGPESVAALRAALGPLSAAVPDDPPVSSWIPCAAQVRLTELIVDHHLAGDLLALEPLLDEDARRGGGRAMRLAAKTLSYPRVVRSAGLIHPHLYDTGEVDGHADEHHATVVFRGAEVFEHPVWRVLQVFGHRGLIALVGGAMTSLEASDEGPGSFALRIGWTR